MTEKHTITLPSGVVIATDTDILVNPDGTIHFIDPEDQGAIEDPESVVPEEELAADIEDRGDGEISGTLYSDDVLSILSPSVRANPYLAVIDKLLNMSDAHYEAAVMVYRHEVATSYRHMSQVMGITEAAASNRMVFIRRLGALEPASSYGEYWLDGTYADVLDEWKNEIDAERARRHAITRVYKSSHGGYDPDF